jgi:hypothetical protein
MTYVRFCVGDRFYMLDGNIVCEYDAEQLLRHTSCYGPTSVALHSSSLLPITDEMSASSAPIDSVFLSPAAAATTGGGSQAHGAVDLCGMQMELGQQQCRLAAVPMTPGAAVAAAAAGSGEYRYTPELLSAQCAGDDRSSGYGSPSACSD